MPGLSSPVLVAPHHRIRIAMLFRYPIPNMLQKRIHQLGPSRGAHAIIAHPCRSSELPSASVLSGSGFTVRCLLIMTSQKLELIIISLMECPLPFHAERLWMHMHRFWRWAFAPTPRRGTTARRGQERGGDTISISNPSAQDKDTAHDSITRSTSFKPRLF